MALRKRCSSPAMNGATQLVIVVGDHSHLLESQVGADVDALEAEIIGR
ncbi:hypothetical protein [Mycolicibacterium sp. TY81]|nr:hypothetical protein [Mycolicibacterium sp. TY81]